MIESTPRVITGIFGFTGTGYRTPTPLDASLVYTVPADKRAQLIYFRAGTSCDAMIALMLMRDGRPMRMFPVGARAATHVPLAVVEDLAAETRIEVHVAAPAGSTGDVVLDLGLMEI